MFEALDELLGTGFGSHPELRILALQGKLEANFFSRKKVLVGWE